MQTNICSTDLKGFDVTAIPSDAKLIWNCRRGMLELDLMLSRFIKIGLPLLDARGRGLFERALEMPDPDLFAYLMGQEPPEDPEMAEIVAYIRAHAQA